MVLALLGKESRAGSDFGGDHAACIGVFGCRECSSVGLALNWNRICGTACCFLTESPVPRGAGGRARCSRRQRYSGWDHFVSVGIELRDIQFGGR